MYSSENDIFNNVISLIKNKDYSAAECKLNHVNNKTALWHYLYGTVLLNKAWFDSALKHFETANILEPDNILYKDGLVSLMRRHRPYPHDYYEGGYHRHRHRGCLCCCDDCCLCDDCCCDGNISCCDLICLDQCCECMGGDFIDCI